MKTNTNKYRTNMDNYIMDCVQDEATSEGMTAQEYIKHRFYAEYDWMIERYGKHRAIREWLQGLAINIAYTYHDILELYAELHGEPCPAHKEDEVCENYFDHMAMNVIRFANI